MLTDLFEWNAIDEVVYKQWLTADTSTSQAITHSTKVLLNIFFEKLQFLLHNSFIEIQQSTPQTEFKLALNTNCCT
jgi:hypothetical protein